MAQNRCYGYGYDAGGAQGSFYDVSLGRVIDAQERVWALSTASRRFLLKVDAASADRVALN